MGEVGGSEVGGERWEEGDRERREKTYLFYWMVFHSCVYIMGGKWSVETGKMKLCEKGKSGNEERREEEDPIVERWKRCGVLMTIRR